MLGVEDTTYLQETGPERGIGRIGAIRPRTFKEFADHVKEVFGLDSLRMVYYKESDLQKPSQEWLSVVEVVNHSILML